jgi:hypothetical protein
MIKYDAEENEGEGGGGKYISEEGKLTVVVAEVGDDKVSMNGSPYFDVTFRSGEKTITLRVYATKKSMWVVDSLIEACGYDPDSIPSGAVVDQKVLVGKSLVVDFKRRGKYLEAHRYHRLNDDDPLLPWPGEVVAGATLPVDTPPAEPVATTSYDTQKPPGGELPF